MLKPVAGRSIEQLVESLSSNDGSVRQRARNSLVGHGYAAVGPLKNLLSSQNNQVRWEAVKALGEIGGPEAARLLVTMLDDNNRDIRWGATDGLIASGAEALDPLLHELITKSGSVWVREAGIRVIDAQMNEGNRDILRPVLSALKSLAPIFDVPIAAYDALFALQRKKAELDSRGIVKVR